MSKKTLDNATERTITKYFHKVRFVNEKRNKKSDNLEETVPEFSTIERRYSVISYEDYVQRGLRSGEKIDCDVIAQAVEKTKLRMKYVDNEKNR
ncbi:hypothetical protein NPIL_580281 [Nephila pilipes]|uniref:Uncharacterized protein n=1 Tax=Nephila pilipes TaxID=299642 RepID=A0A8X6UCP4_NEPPI|nr:hypothetical protein NPIL_580281 [Nephila pilipes]